MYLNAAVPESGLLQAVLIHEGAQALQAEGGTDSAGLARTTLVTASVATGCTAMSVNKMQEGVQYNQVCKHMCNQVCNQVCNQW